MNGEKPGKKPNYNYVAEMKGEKPVKKAKNMAMGGPGKMRKFNWGFQLYLDSKTK